MSLGHSTDRRYWSRLPRGAAIIGLLVASGWLVLAELLPRLDYTQVSEQSSPDGQKRIVELRSQQDGAGQAPYGSLLVLSLGQSVQQPEDGYLFFAGYCRSPLGYRWLNDLAVEVHCQANAAVTSPVVTLAKRMYGIEVKFSEQPAN